ncbi:MAG TPA: TfoX/Sxy family protein [Pirellulales bacterium]|jgi:TfoX/Sxy family transcriptional regulator of competence genes|nr:TfoX/Sxy family protein [Pirellulales bacterium]
MPYSQSLADRVRQTLRSHRNITEKKMFGGLIFMFSGNMLVGIWQQSLIVRLGADRAAEVLGQPHIREFDVTGRPMKNWVMVEPDGLERDEQLAEWIKAALEFVEKLPAK